MQVGERFTVPVQTGPGTHSASYTMDTESFPAVKRQGRDVDHRTPSSAKVKERVEVYVCSPSGPSWTLPFTVLFVGRNADYMLPHALPITKNKRLVISL